MNAAVPAVPSHDGLWPTSPVPGVREARPSVSSRVHDQRRQALRREAAPQRAHAGCRHRFADGGEGARAIHRERAVRRQDRRDNEVEAVAAQRVPVERCLGDDRGSDAAGPRRAGFTSRRTGRAPPPQPRREQADQRVAAARRREGDDEANRPVGEGAGEAGRDRRDRGDEERKRASARQGGSGGCRRKPRRRGARARAIPAHPPAGASCAAG